MILTFIFAFTLWLGCYLIIRSHQNRSVLWIGVGLVVYAAVIALQILSTQAALPATQSLLDNIGAYLLLIPGLFWVFALVTLVTPSIYGNAEPSPSEIPLHKRLFNRSQYSRQGIGLFLAGSILLGMSLGLVIMRLAWIPPAWLAVAVGLDLCLLGYAIARLDAFDLGEALLPHSLRSLDGALLLTLLFSGPVVVVMQLIESERLILWALLLTLVTFAILVQTLREPFEAVLDRVAFGATSPIQQQRADLRAAADAVPKIEPAHPTKTVDEAEFARLTRRALSSFGDLNRLASSPLAQLPLIEQGLVAQEIDINTLTKATELKRLLAEAIMHLKPAGENGFSPTDEWRYYNALYFPYVLGLRPYSRRAEYDDLEPSTQAALDWFRSQVPERTLHNWQNGAAKLVAQYLRELH